MIPVSAVALATEIRMLRQLHSGSFLLVEGRDDRLFMEQFLCRQTCQIVVGMGKDNVRKAIQILEEVNFPGVLGVVDADFDRLDGSESKSPNVVMPEYHDLETMLLCSPALGRVMTEFGTREKLDAFGENVLDALVQRALPLGRLRLYSLRNGLDLTFGGLNYSAWVDRSKFEAFPAQLIEEVKNRSQRQNIPSAILLEAIRQRVGAESSPFEVCNGSDLIEILSIGLRSAFGNNSSTAVNAEVLRRSLRLAYTEQDFVSSGLGKAIQMWEEQAEGFRILGV